VTKPLLPSHRPATALAGAVACSLVLAVGCSRAPGPGAHALWLADLVPTQARNVTTDLIAVPEGKEMDRVVFGWRREPGDEAGGAHLVMARRIGQFELFSADGDVASLRLELGLPPDGPDSVQAFVFLDGKRIGKVVVGRRWSTYEIAVPPEVVRRGRYFVDLWTEPGRRQMTAEMLPLRLRRLTVLSRSGRSVWADRPGSLRVLAGEEADSASRTVEMPVASDAEVVMRIPPAGRVTGRVEGEPKAGTGDVEAYVTLLDEKQAEHPLLAERFPDPGSPRRFGIDLSRWAGQLARVRFGTTGAGNGVVRWHRTAISADEPFAAPSLPPVGHEVPERSSRLGRPDVLLILLDAARADAFSPFGGPHPTPALERLAGSGTVFTEATSPSAWTGQSVPAILTGHSPDALGVGGWGSELPQHVAILPELASSAGYRTVLWSQHPYYWGTDLWKRFDEAHRAPEKDYGAIPSAAAIGGGERPTLAFVHLIPPHTPYTPPPPFLGAYSSWYSGSQPIAPKALHRSARNGVGGDDVRYVRDRYQENAAFADHLVGRILADLQRAGRYDKTLVVVLSDHGEAFMEHGRFMHTRYVHREYVHVPLVVKWPADLEGFRPRVSDPVSLLDLVPTLVDGLGLTGGEAGFMGRDLLPVVFDGKSREGAIYAMTRGESDGKRVPVPWQMLQEGPWRLLFCPFDGQSLLYDAFEDPGEDEDVSDEHALQAMFMRQQLLAQSAWNREQARAEGEDRVLEDPSVLEQLEALGYVN